MGTRFYLSLLSVILVVAFAFQLLAVISVPVTRKITLCTYGNIQFGVFGYCDTKTDSCSSVGIGYGDVTSIDGFSLPSKARHTLASLLIVHVVAAGLTLILLVLTLAAQFATSSSKFLLIMLIFSLPCFLLSLLAFLVDILLFVPHLDWGGWIVLASTVLIAIFGVFLCVLRRTASSQKAMERRIHENSELQSLGQYSSAFSGGASYKPTTSSGDLIFSNSIDDYNSKNLFEFTEVKFEPHVSNHSVPGTDDNIPLARNMATATSAPPNPVEYENLRQNTPSPSRDYIAGYHHPVEQPAAPDYNNANNARYTDTPQSRYTDNSYSRHDSFEPNAHIIPAGTYDHTPPQALMPPLPPHGEQQQPPPNNASAQSLLNVISAAPYEAIYTDYEQGGNSQSYSDADVLPNQPDLQQTAMPPPAPLNPHIAQPKHSVQSFASSSSQELSSSSNFTSVSQREPNPRFFQQQQPVMDSQRAAAQRQDLLLQSNPDFHVAPPRRQQNRANALKTSQNLRNLGEDGPYGISKRF